MEKQFIKYRSGSTGKEELYDWIERNLEKIEPKLTRNTFLRLKMGEPEKAIIELIPPCDNCKPLEKERRFKNISDFDAQYKYLSTLEKSGKLIKIKEPNWLNIDTQHLGAAVFYKCKKCGSLWHLAVPERAFKGFWKRIC